MLEETTTVRRPPASLPRILPLEDAAREMGISPDTLADLVQSGRIPAYLAQDGQTMVPVSTLEQRPTLDIINQHLSSIQRTRFAHLEGQALTLREASKQFGVPAQTIYQWTRRGYVRVLHKGTSKSNPTLVDASDVAYCAAIRKVRRQFGILAGAPLLDQDGNPYLLKRPLSIIK